MQGTLSHWMTYSGTLMLVICATVARLLYGTRDRLWAAFVLPALIVSLALTLTRGAWIGAAAGTGVLFLIKDFRLTALISVVIAAALLVAPDAAVEPHELHRRHERSDHAATAWRCSRPAWRWSATIPGPASAPTWSGTSIRITATASAVQANNPHLHNVPMQIAAERGLPALRAVAVLRDHGRRRPVADAASRGVMPLAAAGMGALVAMLAAGSVEYNFGDSEFLMLLLVLITLPFAAARDGGPSR